jgi:hypothetical protein
LFRQPEGRWLGVRASPMVSAGGLSVGSGVLLGINGEIGRVWIR